MKKERKARSRNAAANKVRPIPAGYHAVTPYLSVRGAAQAIEFYKTAFGAREVMRMPGTDGRLGHAEISLGDSRVMLSDEYREMDFLGPRTRGGTTVQLHVYVDDCDAQVAKAVAAGAKLLRPVKDQFYGDRSGCVEDPFGHVWHFSTHKEDVPMDTLKQRAEELAALSEESPPQAVS